MKNDKKISRWVLAAILTAAMGLETFGAVLQGPGFDESNYQNSNIPTYTTNNPNWNNTGYGNYPNNYPYNNYPNYGNYPDNNYPYNNPAYNTGWNQGGGPGNTGGNPMGNREDLLNNIYTGGPGSEGANQILNELENGFYIYNTYQGGTWEELPDGKWRLLDGNGQPVSSQWAYVGGKTYLLDMYGIMLTGFQIVNEKKYYFNSVGAMQTGWLLKEGKYYFLNSDGSMSYGWVNSQGSWYFMDQYTGVMMTNAWTPDGRYVNAEGVMIP